MNQRCGWYIRIFRNGYSLENTINLYLLEESITTNWKYFMNILILGSGGREHALAWRLSQSPDCTSLYIAPGNAGTQLHGVNVDTKSG